MGRGKGERWVVGGGGQKLPGERVNVCVCVYVSDCLVLCFGFVSFHSHFV